MGVDSADIEVAQDAADPAAALIKARRPPLAEPYRRCTV
jgi:hypothetical protein